MEAYKQVINAFKPDKAETDAFGGKLFKRLFDGIIEEI